MGQSPLLAGSFPFLAAPRGLAYKT